MKPYTREQKNITYIAGIVGLILLVPLCGNLFISGWNWGFLDFVVMGALLFGAGLAISYAVRKIPDPTYRVIAIIGILVILFGIWLELAVDGISQLIDFLSHQR